MINRQRITIHDKWDFAVGKADFQLTCLDSQAENVE